MTTASASATWSSGRTDSGSPGATNSRRAPSRKATTTSEPTASSTSRPLTRWVTAVATTSATASCQARRLRLFLDQDSAQLVFLARLEDREHRVPGLELKIPLGDLGLPVAHDRDQARARRQGHLLDRLPGTVGLVADRDLDDLEVLLPQV